MPKQAAGILLYRRGASGLEVLLAHPGGPLWARKDAGSWTIPKGQFTGAELPLDAARREFEEEMGTAPHGDFQPLGTVKQPSGKMIHAWARRIGLRRQHRQEQPVLDGMAAAVGTVGRVS